jgi:DNA (cytosine-5)-methyltransferase 1
VSTDISYGSFCTGYDGIGLGLRLAGLPLAPLWMSENEAAMGRVLKREHDGVPNVGDLKTVPWQLAPKVRLVSSGDPCQSISIAGRQEGRKDERFLWPWVRAAYREIRPAFIFFENVANIVSHDSGRTMAERFEHLREDGYAVRWTVLGACAVGAPHHRHRWYALAAYVGPGAPEAVRVGGGKAICGAPRTGGRLLLPSPMARDGDGRGEGDPEYWTRRLELRGRTNGRPLDAEVLLLPSPRGSGAGRYGTEVNRAGRTKTGGTLSDALAALPLLPTPRATDVGTAGRRSSEGWRPQLGQAVHALLPTPTAGDADRGTGSIGSTGSPMLGAAALEARWGKYAEAVALWEVVTGVPAPEPTEPGKNGPRLSAMLPEWMMGLRPGLLTDELSRSEALKGAGNGCVPLAVAAAYQMLSRG